MIGVVQSRELLAAMLSGQPLDIRKHVQPAPVIPDTLYALDALAILRDAEVPMALVHDEYGHFEGVVTPADALEAIVGAFRSDGEAPEPDAVRREDGSWLLAGSMPVDEMAEILGVTLPESRSYHTVGGLVISEMQHLPTTGEHVEPSAGASRSSTSTGGGSTRSWPRPSTSGRARPRYISRRRISRDGRRCRGRPRSRSCWHRPRERRCPPRRPRRSPGSGRPGSPTATRRERLAKTVEPSFTTMWTGTS